MHTARTKIAFRDGIFFAAIWGLLLLGGGSNFFRDPGSFWHVAVGQRIRDRGFFEADPYTYTFNGDYWIPHQWLGEWLMALAFWHGGFDLLLLGATVILAAVFGAVSRRYFQVGMHPLLVILLVFLGIAASAGQFHIRPHLATIVGTFITTSLLIEAEAGRISFRSLAILIPIFIVWSNIHGGVLAGLAIITLIFCGWIALGFFQRGPITTRRDRVIAGGILLACFLTTLINPFGWKVPASWLKIYTMQSLPQVINEHMPLGFNTPGWPWIILLAVVYACMGFAVPLRNWRLSFFIPIVFGIATITRARHAPLFAVSGLLLMAEMLPAIKWKNWRQCDLSSSEKIPFLQSAILPVILIIVAVLSVWMMGYKDRFESVWIKLDRKAWPIESLPALREEVRTVSHRPRVFCEYQFGSFLILFEPRCLVFIDDRCELFGDDFLTDFANTRYALQTHQFADPGSPLDRWQSEHGPMDLALVFTNGPFDSAFASRPSDWKIVKQDETATLYARVKPIKLFREEAPRVKPTHQLGE